ncbi:gamma-glutamyltransferase family protein [Lampropedia puyangensis]|uniref:Gamma-glutamyltransferase family protein n=1 Tax=Lampropedia puyangensis TaxID=1330072 RepID=A0A4S8F975_9BURK|nr:gamma-glutamyltransferase family protein [Lampropedia puyangensis]THU03797.1 gamma-glutamyltransferase family protein [Lampropedia puyangensis]
MVTAPNALASQSALAVLREGGNAVEAMVAAASTIAVVYPHMNSIGGDGFWLIAKPGQAPIGIDACGAAAQAVNAEALRSQGLASIPFRGGVAANTVAGTISGWDAALSYARQELGAKLPLERLLADAIAYARDGIPVTQSQANCTAQKLDGLQHIAGFSETFLTADGHVPAAGSIFRQPRLAATLERLAQAGLDDFYRGDLAASMARDLQGLGSPLSQADLAAHHAVVTEALVLQHSLGRIYNMPPPTQGLVSLMILGQLDRLVDVKKMTPTSASYVHACVEATKQAFAVRDRYITDPAYMAVNPANFLQTDALDQLAAGIDPHQAQPWGNGKGPADTVWMGVIDHQGVAVSFIQSIYHEFGSGLVLPESGVNWQNRGCSFSLDANALNPLMPGRKPFHTLNPAMAQFDDGRCMVYGNMGGDGQPQSQSAVFSRIAYFGMNPQAAIAAPRWLLGRTWGQTSESLKLESRFPAETIEALRQMGHEVDVLNAYDETMGHAGAIVRHPNGTLEGGNDPRSDGAALGW